MEASAKKASDARELLWLKKKEEDEQKTKAIATQGTPLRIMAQAALNSPIDDVFGALEGEMDEATPDIAAEVCLYVRKLLTLANDHKILKGASFVLHQDYTKMPMHSAREWPPNPWVCMCPPIQFLYTLNLMYFNLLSHREH